MPSKPKSTNQSNKTSPFSEALKTEINKPFADAEEEVLTFWEKQDILRKSIDNRPDSKLYTFYDGPITANNSPHWGHAVTFLFKDITPRYWTMKGYKVPRSLGWDCQGIPVEYEVEKRMGFEHKSDIEKFGIEKFNQLCRESVLEYQKDIRALTRRMGRWVNSDEEYATMDSWYIESLFWSLKELYNKGLLYEGHKVVPYSTRAGTPLSNSEVALGGYSDIVDPAVTVKFKLKGEDKFVLAWTTTPWTLPGNLLLAVGQDFDYVEVSFENNTYVVAADLVEAVFGDKTKIAYKIGKKFKSVDLIGKEYEPLFPYYKDKVAEGAFKIVHADHVTLEDGTGIVHQAPYGEEDFFLMTGMGIKLFDYLDDMGHFTKEVPEYEGMFYKKANSKIIEDLEGKGLMFGHKDYTHKMPMCWRTDTPLIYKPIKSWYVNVTKIQKNLLKENDEINWVPKHIKDGRFGNWLTGARDWALSRSRYWGTPLPIWQCKECQHTEVLGSLQEIEDKSGIKLEDPHKPFIDEVKYKCEKCGGLMTRIPDVIDVWYDSGAMPFARLHYPFQNKDLFKEKFPAMYIAEGIDQTRGWFYTLHVLGVALFDSKAFENVVVNGFALAEDGRKMSKRLKNYAEPMELLGKIGADVVRMYFLMSPVTKAEDIPFGEKLLKETMSTVIFPLWNSVKYFLSYAEIHNWLPADEKSPKSKNVLDVWVTSKFNETVQKVRENIDKYDLQKSSLAITAFIDDLSKWYIRRSRERFVAGDEEALATLYWVLVELAKLLAPMMPFITERIYMMLVASVDKKALESVHLTDYPEVGEINQELLNTMANVRQVVSNGQALRVAEGLKLRQPLSEVQIKGAKFDNEMTAVISEELNVLKVTYTDKLEKSWPKQLDKDIEVALDKNISSELKKEGLYNELVRMLQNARKNAGLKMGELVTVKFYSTDEDVDKLFKETSERLKSDVSLLGFEKASEKPKDAELLKVDDNELWVAFKK